MFFLTFILWFIFVASCATMKPATYEETVAHWTSYQDVASWMKTNFRMDYERARIGLGTKLQPRTPEQT